MSLTFSPLRKIVEDQLSDQKRFFNDLRLLSLDPFPVTNQSFPPYNLYELEKDKYVIEIALAGYSTEDLSVVLQNNQLVVSANKSPESEEDSEKYVHRGIAKRAFKTQFRVAEYTEIEDCVFQDGILKIVVFRNIPEEKLPKTIKIRHLTSKKK